MSRILVVDDNDSIRRLLRRLLEEEGHTVVEAPNGRMALMHMHHSPFELVISDVFMPDINGFEFLINMRDTNPATRIIMMSGGGVSKGEDIGITSTLAAAAKLGATRVFEKPFDVLEILEAVRTLLVDEVA